MPLKPKGKTQKSSSFSLSFNVWMKIISVVFFSIIIMGLVHTNIIVIEWGFSGVDSHTHERIWFSFSSALALYMYLNALGYIPRIQMNRRLLSFLIIIVIFAIGMGTFIFALEVNLPIFIHYRFTNYDNNNIYFLLFNIHIWFLIWTMSFTLEGENP